MTQRITAVVLSALATICVCAASVYAGLLSVVLVIKGTSHQTEIHPIIYLGVGIAAAMTLVGYAIAGRVREGIPGAAALLIVGAMAQPLTWAISSTFRHAHWSLVVVFAAIPCLVIVAGGVIQRRMFPT